MKIKKEDLMYYKDYVTYNDGYRILYYYEKYHEAPRGLYAKNIEDFIELFKDNDIKCKSIDDILSLFLSDNKKALGVAIYSVNQDCIGKKIRDDVKTINDSVVYKEELIYDFNTVTATDGYRVIYFYSNNSYRVGPFSKTIDGFMIDFVPFEPILDDDDIPPFVSVEDVLNRYLKLYDAISGVAIYKIDGNLIAKKEKNSKKCNKLK